VTVPTQTQGIPLEPAVTSKTTATFQLLEASGNCWTAQEVTVPIPTSHLYVVHKGPLSKPVLNTAFLVWGWTG
jgi:hypothetical protein